MIILPDRRIVRTKFLVPVPELEWRAPSSACQKDEFGAENNTKFWITARLHDGHVVWRGRFDDRNDADAFLFAMFSGSLLYERELWRLPTPWWPPDIGENVQYEFASKSQIVSTSASNQTESAPSDWNNSNNTIEVVGSGASGGLSFIGGSGGLGSGGSGGGYSKATNVTLSGTITFFLNAGGSAITGVPNSSNGISGSATWYNGTTAAGSSVAANGGTGGAAAGTARTGGTVVTGSGFTGGGSGACTNNTFVGAASGGGGAAGPSGAGGTSAAATNTATAGGRGNNSTGGTGGAASTAGGTATSGSAGTEWTGGWGSGGGGGGCIDNGAAINSTSGAGGNYGAGSGGCVVNSASVCNVAAGKQGMIVKTWTPASLFGKFRSINQAVNRASYH